MDGVGLSVPFQRSRRARRGRGRNHSPSPVFAAESISMRLALVSTLTALAFAIVAPISWQARAGSEEVKFRESHADGVHYATVERGNIKEDIFTSRATIEAVKAGQPIPSGTVITLVDHRDGKLFRYVVMEKRVGWGQGYPPRKAQRRMGVPGVQCRQIGQ